MGKFGLSATEIGSRIGASPIEVNRLLKDQGFLDGEPGAYGLTSKGEEFGVQRSHDNGYGGYAARSWETTHFDPSITDVIDASPDKLAKVRADISADKQAQKAARKVAQAEAEANFQAFEAKKRAAETQEEIDPQKLLLLAAGALAVGLTAKGVQKCVGLYKRHRAEKAAQAEPDPSSSTGPKEN